jgi:hypothetical protein
MAAAKKQSVGGLEHFSQRRARIEPLREGTRKAERRIGFRCAEN